MAKWAQDVLKMRWVCAMRGGMKCALAALINLLKMLLRTGPGK